ncbi:MAG: hypothetical protein ACUZ8O_04230 [Candidatus Anammoxibacter sp.]
MTRGYCVSAVGLDEDKEIRQVAKSKGYRDRTKTATCGGSEKYMCEKYNFLLASDINKKCKDFEES